jgi:hypothetical protein
VREQFRLENLESFNPATQESHQLPPCNKPQQAEQKLLAATKDWHTKNGGCSSTAHYPTSVWARTDQPEHRWWKPSRYEKSKLRSLRTKTDPVPTRGGNENLTRTRKTAATAGRLQLRRKNQANSSCVATGTEKHKSCARTE